VAVADALPFAVPLYNFGGSQHLRPWVDLVITDPRMGAGTDPVIAGTPAVLATAHGGAYGPGTPREGWDHPTGWMRRILEDVWKLDLRVVESEFTLRSDPQLDEFKELAAGMRSHAEDLARAHGRSLSAKLAA
jgi:FMN-dependent NADH-azoreductase